MKSLQDYVNTYRDIANSLNIRGDSAELLIQLLANASYISEVENISYSQEASLERATLMNSKIQHCVDNMYSVFRGTCPRVILNLKSLKHITFNPYDEIIASKSFKVYYLGCYDKNLEGTSLNYSSGVSYSSITVKPGDNIQILGLLAKETVKETWSVDSNNLYYLDSNSENLSNDVLVTIDKNTSGIEVLNTTRQFSEHVLEHKVFDLTLPSFGSRLYISGAANGENFVPGHTISATYFKYSAIDTYNNSELMRLGINGFELQPFDTSWKEIRNLKFSEIASGIVIIPESTRDLQETIHYKANQDRYLSTIFRSNSDLGGLFENSFSDKVSPGGINTKFSTNESGSSLVVYYIPINEVDRLSDGEKKEFIEDKKAYYITDEINIEEGSGYDVMFNIEVELYQLEGGKTIDEDIEKILKSYNKKFNVNFLTSSDINGNSTNPELLSSSVFLDIQTLISKIPNVKRIRSLTINYLSPSRSGELMRDNSEGTNNDWNTMIEDIIEGKAYYNISQSITKIL